MRYLWITSFPRSGQSLIVNAIGCLDAVWVESPSNKEFLLKPLGDVFQNREFSMAKFTGNGRNDGVLQFGRSHTIPQNAIPFIHIVRDPRDIACSYARFAEYQHRMSYGVALENIAEGIEIPNVARITIWGDHVLALENSPQRILTVKYEDALSDPLSFCINAFAKAGWTTRRIMDYPNFSYFSKLSEWYYKRGTSGVWKTEMPEAIASKIKSRLSDVMNTFGYE